MKLLLEEEKKILGTTSKQLNELIEKTLQFKSDPDFNKKESTLQISVERYQNQLKNRKHTQFMRDSEEFKTDKAYNFSGVDTVSEISSSEAECSDTEGSGGYWRQRERGGFSSYRGKKKWQRQRGYMGGHQGGRGHNQGFMGQTNDASGFGAPTRPLVSVPSSSIPSTSVPSSSYDLRKRITFSWVKDLNLYCRKLKWKKFFSLHNKQQCLELGISEDDLEGFNALTDLLEENERGRGLGPQTDLKLKSSRMPPPQTPPPPPGDYTNINIFLKVVEDDLRKIGRRNADTPPNLSAEEWEALDKLEKNDQIVVKPSDKGGNLVILDHQKYVGMCKLILNDRETYGILENDPTERFTGSLRMILDAGLDEKLISYNEYRFLTPRTPMIPTFYALPNVHKGLSPLKGRPIVSGVGSLSQNVGIYIDNILRPFVTSLPSYVRDTSDLLQKIDGIVVEQGTILGSIDVEALYSSIPHTMGLKALEYY
ncbi:unnamed protein product [Ranitomeya imitator]|uniref:RNA polymerase alpha subunit n=1 Tax=Ranitomeya imitator TaxID=111125 RepID=A0ABN9KMD9_9NEOB|nr:unnamed protein product [Ranitomeya imitator]